MASTSLVNFRIARFVPCLPGCLVQTAPAFRWAEDGHTGFQTRELSLVLVEPLVGTAQANDRQQDVGGEELEADR
jgi:hypothetical protein